MQGTFAGSPRLSPEKADSYTAGLVFTPTFLRGLRASADYISIDLKDIIFPTNQTQALQFCFDSRQFPDNSSAFGVNTCSLTRRNPMPGMNAFQLDNGFTLGFLNLAAQEVRALNGSIDCTFDVGDLFGGGDWGQLNLKYRANFTMINALDENLLGFTGAGRRHRRQVRPALCPDVLGQLRLSK